MGAVTLSLYWGRLPREGWLDEPHAIDADGKVLHPNLGMGWNVKLCGLERSERNSFARKFKDQELYMEDSMEEKMLNWFIRREQYDVNAQTSRRRSGSDDKDHVSKYNRMDAPLEFITKYIDKLMSLGYTIVAAPPFVCADQNSVWMLTKQEKPS